MVKSTRVRSMRRILILLMCRIRIGYYRYTRGDSFDSQKITEGQEEGRVAGCKIKKEADVRRCVCVTNIEKIGAQRPSHQSRQKSVAKTYNRKYFVREHFLKIERGGAISLTGYRGHGPFPVSRNTTVPASTLTHLYREAQIETHTELTFLERICCGEQRWKCYFSVRIFLKFKSALLSSLL